MLEDGRILNIAGDYIAHGVRHRAEALVTLELGQQSELEVADKLRHEMHAERLTRLDRMLIAESKEQGIIDLRPDASDSYTVRANRALPGGTAWEALVSRAALRVGESILIHGGAGGVGHVAIKVAKAIGAKVFTTVRKDNFDFARSIGADVVIDYRHENYIDVIMRETDGRGVDVVFDTLGGDTLTHSPHVLAQLGRVISIVEIAQPQNLIEAWGKNASYHFVFTRQNQGKLDELATLVERGQLRPHVGAILSAC